LKAELADKKGRDAIFASKVVNFFASDPKIEIEIG